EKVDADNTNNKLPGATFEVYNHNNELVETLTTLSDGTVTSSQLPEGTYTLVETSAPVGYQVIDGKDLTVTIDGDANEPVKIVISNKLANGKIKIIKVDEDDENIQLEGATFNLLDGSNVVSTLTTDANGE